MRVKIGTVLSPLNMASLHFSKFHDVSLGNFGRPGRPYDSNESGVAAATVPGAGEWTVVVMMVKEHDSLPITN